MTDFLITADARDRQASAEFFAAIFGHAPKTREQRQAESDVYWAKRDVERRREIEQLRDRLCAQASPKLQAQFREQWAREDAAVVAADHRRAA